MKDTYHLVCLMIKRVRKWIEEAKYIYKKDPAARSVFEVYFLYPGLKALRDHQIAKKYYETGELQHEITFINGKAHGTMKGYYKSGQLEIEELTVEGYNHGPSKGYYESGKLN